MTQINFNDIILNQLKMCELIMVNKEEEYSFDKNDRLKAFKRLWLKDNKNNTKQVLWGQLSKHLDSIYDMCNQDINFDKVNYSKWLEKITDSINYLLLLRGIIEENVETK